METEHPQSRRQSTSRQHQAKPLTGSAETGVTEISPPYEPPHISITILGHRMHTSRSVLALAFGKECIFAGLQGGHIMAWCLETYAPVLLVHAHEESVLGLFTSDDKELLFSSGGDSVVNVWCTRSFRRLYSIYSHHDVGDIFTVVYSSQLKTVYCGGQNTSLQWCNLENEGNEGRLESHPHHRTHRFFDSKGPGERKPSDHKTDQNPDNGICHQDGHLLAFKKSHHLLYAHNSYIYRMLLLKGIELGTISSNPDSELLLTASGDGSVKIWSIEHQKEEKNTEDAPVEIASLNNGFNSVLSVAVDGPFLYCGLDDGVINVWNLESRQIVRRVSNVSGDVWALDIMSGHIMSGDSSGLVKKFNIRWEEAGSWEAHSGVILASASGTYNGKNIYATGGNDNTVAIWDIQSQQSCPFEEEPSKKTTDNDQMINSLAKFVELKSISGHPKHSGECNQTATFFRRLCAYMGAQTKLLAAGPAKNPIVYARFNASPSTTPGDRPAKTILFYGHYDVVFADGANSPKWKSDPFKLTSLNGYLYGRGVSDNKGPILAALYATAELHIQRELGCNVVFLIEGEEESGSQGFCEAVTANKGLIGDIDYILLANSYWLDDRIPCLTYGLRGVVNAEIIVAGPHPDLHSGIDGSTLLDEPLKDLTLLLAMIVGPKGKINIPGFYDSVLPLTESEKMRYDNIAAALLPHHPNLINETGSYATEEFKKSLMHRWREPAFTIHSIDVPTSTRAMRSTTISRQAKAMLSIRIVPNQEPEVISRQLVSFVRDKFSSLDSQNYLTVGITREAEAWLGDPENDIFAALERAVSEVWSNAQQKSGKTYDFPAASLIGSRNIKSSGMRLTRSDSFDSVRSQASGVIGDRAIASSSPFHNESSLKEKIPTSSSLVNNYPDPTAQLLPSGGSTPSESSGADKAALTSASVTQPPPSVPLDHEQEQAVSSEPSTFEKETKPLYIREGGSIPTIRVLEKIFHAPAAHLPCGQASDHAHLDNERLRIENLYRSREIFGHVFGRKGVSQPQEDR